MGNPHTAKSTRSDAPPTGRANRRLIVWAVLICLAFGLLIAGRVVVSTRQPGARSAGGDASLSAKVPTSAPESHMPSSQIAERRGDQVLLIDDDRETLWISPTDGPPLELAYLPPGVQIVVALRPAAFAGHPEMDKVFDAAGPLGMRGAQLLDEVLRNPFGVQQAIIGCRISESDAWEATLLARLSGRTAAEHVADRLPNAVEKSHNGQSYRLADGRAYYLLNDDDTLLVVAPESSIADIIDLAGDPPLLRRDVERLLAHTDADRHVTVIFAPNFLFSDGRRLFDGQMAGLRDPLFWFLGDELSAAALSVHWDDNFFVELVATPTLDTSPERAARILAERLAQVPEKLEQYVARLDPQPYGRAVVERFPGMVRRLVAYSRSGFEPDHAVLRCYLPTVAGHNLLMGAELTLAELAGGARTVAEATAPSAMDLTQTNTARERLRRVTTLSFPRDTLEAALDQLGQDVGVPIVIRSADLQAEGITKNQSFGIDLENRPAEEILVEILRLANPDKTATGPGDPRQKLVYVVLPAGPGGGEQIAVTTRAAVAERGEVLPPVFEQEQP